MSEPSSFFTKIHIKKDQLSKFLNAKPSIAKTQDGWTDWWNTREMYGKAPLSIENLCEYNQPSNKDIIDSWLLANQVYAFSDYDETQENWYFGITLFTENYYEMIPMISAIRGVGSYKEKEDQDFILIFSYFWDPDSINAYLQFKGSKSSFSNCPQENHQLAIEYFQRIRF